MNQIAVVNDIWAKNHAAKFLSSRLEILDRSGSALDIALVNKQGVIYKPCGSTRGGRGGRKISALLIKAI